MLFELTAWIALPSAALRPSRRRRAAPREARDLHTRGNTASSRAPRGSATVEARERYPTAPPTPSVQGSPERRATCVRGVIGAGVVAVARLRAPRRPPTRG